MGGGGGEGGGVFDGDGEAGVVVTADPGDAGAGDVGVDDGTTAGHGFDLDEAEGFGAGVAGEPEGGGGAVSAGELVVGGVAVPDDAVGDAGVFGLLLELFFEGAAADDEELTGGGFEGGDRGVEALVVDEAADGEPEGLAVLLFEFSGEREGVGGGVHEGVEFDAEGEKADHVFGVFVEDVGGGEAARVGGPDELGAFVDGVLKGAEGFLENLLADDVAVVGDDEGQLHAGAGEGDDHGGVGRVEVEDVDAAVGKLTECFDEAGADVVAAETGAAAEAGDGDALVGVVGGVAFDEVNGGADAVMFVGVVDAEDADVGAEAGLRAGEGLHVGFNAAGGGGVVFTEMTYGNGHAGNFSVQTRLDNLYRPILAGAEMKSSGRASML